MLSNNGDVDNNYCDGSSLAQNICLFCDALGMRNGQICCSEKEAFEGCFEVTEFYLESYMEPASSGVHDIERRNYHKRTQENNYQKYIDYLNSWKKTFQH
jgi:hypothetical protein